jgi:hypothetical protein
MTDDGCTLCQGKGVLDLSVGWKEYTVWCPRCNPGLFEGAASQYRKRRGGLSCFNIRVIRGR